MKATVISIFILFVSQVYGRDYQPLLSNGKSWTMVQRNTSPVHDHDAIYTCTVDRDTMINGQACKVVMRCNEGNCDKVVMMEKEEKVFYYDPNIDSFLPILDFSLHQGDEIGEWGWVLTEDEIIVNGTPRKRLFIGDKNQIACVIKAIWVEGIGSNEDCWITLFDKHIGDYCYMTECYEKGNCIFMTADFLLKEGTSGLNIPKVNCPKNDQIYDLQGRKRGSIRKGGIFIRNGKKHINRSI